MRRCNDITAKLIVWIAGALIPFQTAPVRACGCEGPAATSARVHGCCGGSHCCCCKGRPGGVCRCSANKSAPSPAPLPGNSRPDNSKSPLATCAPAGLATVATVVLAGTPAGADQRTILPGSSAPERLSILCRLVI